jgi:hypothetical protein
MGWDAAGGVLDTLCCELSTLADELSETPREHDQVLLLGEIAAFLSGWSTPCVTVAHRFAAMAARAADAMQAQIDKAAGQDAVQQGLQARQCYLRMLSLLCYSPSTLDPGAMVKLMVQVKHGRVFTADCSMRAELEALHARCHNVMSACTVLVTQQVLLHPKLLTKASACVLQRTPDGLKWQQLEQQDSGGAFKAGSFRAVGTDGHLYSINIIDGTVLLDGSPPCRLANDILHHPTYRRSFGDLNFEIVTTATGVKQTIKPVGGRYYDFSINRNALVVEEIDRERDVRMRLLDVGDGAACSPCSCLFALGSSTATGSAGGWYVRHWKQ